MGSTTSSSTLAATADHLAPAEARAATADGVDSASASVGEAEVHAADSYSRGALRWGYFLLLNAIAGAVAIAFFVAVFYADGLDPYLMGTYQWLLDHPGVTSALAFSPLACSLLVGYGYASRARKRKKAAAQKLAAQEAARERKAEPAPLPAE